MERHLRWFMPHPHLDDAVHVRDEAVDADFQQHDQGPAHVLTHLTVLVTRQRKQTLEIKERKKRKGEWEKLPGLKSAMLSLLGRIHSKTGAAAKTQRFPFTLSEAFLF